MVYAGDQDFYCSFTHLPHAHTSTVNLDELPYTIHSPYSIDRIHHSRAFPRHARSRSHPGMNSFSSTSSTSSFTSLTSFLSRSSSRRKRKFIAKVRHIIPGRRKSAPAITSLLTSRKPSTLDFRCIGPAEDGASVLLSRVSTLNLVATAAWNLPLYEAPPRLDWRVPDIWEHAEWGATWFAAVVV